LTVSDLKLTKTRNKNDYIIYYSPTQSERETENGRQRHAPVQRVSVKTSLGATGIDRCRVHRRRISQRVPQTSCTFPLPAW